jgi:hypothetical protein
MYRDRLHRLQGFNAARLNLVHAGARGIAPKHKLGATILRVGRPTTYVEVRLGGVGRGTPNSYSSHNRARELTTIKFKQERANTCFGRISD